MKKIILFSVFIFSISLSFGQSWMWGRQGYSPSFRDFGAEWQDHTIAVDKAGNTYIVGSFDETLSFGTDTLKCGNDWGVYLVKYAPNGNVLWARQSHGSPNDGGGSSVAVDRLGDVYITGLYTDSISFGTDTLKNNSYIDNMDMYIVKYDANGNVLWAKQAVNTNDTSYAYGNSIAVDTLGDAYVTGTFDGIVSFGNDTLKDLQNWIIPFGSSGWLYIYDVFIVKYDALGNVLWARQSNAPNAFCIGMGSSITVDKNGNAYITGEFTDTISFSGDSLKTSDLSNVFLVKYSASGNVVWAKQAIDVGAGGIGGISVSIDEPGGIYVAGQFYDTVSFNTDTLKETTLNGDAFLVKYNESGNIIWAKQAYILDSNAYYGCSVVCDTLQKGGGYILINGNGSANSPAKVKFGADTFSSNSPLTASLLLQFDSAGNPLCGMMFNSFTGYGGSVGASPSGKYIYLTGDIDTTTVFGPDTLTLGNQYQYLPFVARWQSCTNNTPNGVQKLKPNQTISIFPNPFTNSTTVAVNTEGKHYLEVYDLTGRKLQSTEFTGKQYELSAQGLAKGMYFIRVFDNQNALIGTDKIVVQ